MNISLRSSQSSYGDPRYLSTATIPDANTPIGKSLVDGYRDALDPQHDDRSRYNPLNAAHPRSSALVNTNDPVTMYLLTETAIGDSNNYEILSFEEVEALKKERILLTSRIEGTKRKLALETKLRDAAQSIGRLYSPPSPRDSGDYGANGANGSSKSHRRSRSIFGKNGATGVLDKSDSELAMSQRKCEDLAQELWKLERRSQQIGQRLLEHTAGVLQMTHKGMRKAPKNLDGPSDNAYDGHDFDDRSLYRTPEHLDNYGLKGRVEVTGATTGVSSEAMETTQRRLEELSERMCNMMIEATPDEFVDPPPKSASRSLDSTSAAEAHLLYLENGLNALNSRPIAAPVSAPGVGTGPAPEAEGAWKQQITDVNERLQNIVDRFGLTRSPTLPPPPSAYEGEGLEEQLSYLQAGVDGLASRVDGLLEQKSILTTQIQQQRELNSKSDAERDAHIGDLTEQLSHARRDGKSAQDELAVVMQQLEAMRRDGSSQDEAKAALVQTEGELARLQSVVESLHLEADARTEEVRETRDRAEHEASQAEAQIEEMREARDRAEQQVTQLEVDIQQIRSESESRMQAVASRGEEADSRVQEAESRAQDAIIRLQEAESSLKDATSRLQESESRLHESEKRLQEAESQLQENEYQLQAVNSRGLEDDSRVHAADSRAQEAESRLEEADARMREAESRLEEVDSRFQEAVNQRIQAEENSSRLQNEMTEMEGEVVRITTELTMVKAELDGAYGTRAQRAAEAAANPEFQNEIDALNTRNIELTEELAALKSQRGGGDLQQRADTLEKELRETIDDYEAMTKASIEFEKERERFEGVIDSLRDRSEQLEQQLSEERINWMNLSSPTSMGRDPTLETTSTMVLKNEFKKMMRDTRNENMKILKAEQEERRRIEGLLRALRKEHSQGFFEQDPEAGPGPSTARFYARSDTAPHLSDYRTSTSTSPEDDSDPRTLYSDEEYIVNAITRPTPNDDHKTPDVQPVEEDLASHVAMFLPSSSSESAPQSSRHGKILGQERTGYWWRGEFISDGLYKPYSHLDGEIRPLETAIQPARRRAISLETFDGSAANPQWPRNVPAVRVHQPPYPPPERMPTPPGLPSFGTPEAMATSAQFLRGPESSTSRRHEHSPSAAIRRLFGLQPPAQPTPPSSPVAATAPTAAQCVQGIGRAPDGTAVLGRFGYRQSGHGMNLTQGLDDHTFHVDGTPDAPAEPTPAESRRSSEGTIADSFKSSLSRPKRYGRIFRPSIVGLFVPSSPARGSPSPARGSPSPERGIPLPEPVLAVPPRNPARNQRQQGDQDRPPRTNSSSNRRDPSIRGAQMREPSPMSNSFQRHTIVNQTIQEEESDTEAISQPNVARKLLSQIPVQIPLCCCFGGRITQRIDEGVPLEVIASRDSYTTAPSRSSPTRAESPQRHESNENNSQSESHAWTPLYNFVRRGVAVWNQHIT